MRLTIGKMGKRIVCQRSGGDFTEDPADEERMGLCPEKINPRLRSNVFTHTGIIPADLLSLKGVSVRLSEPDLIIPLKARHSSIEMQIGKSVSSQSHFYFVARRGVGTRARSHIWSRHALFALIRRWLTHSGTLREEKWGIKKTNSGAFNFKVFLFGLSVSESSWMNHDHAHRVVTFLNLRMAPESESYFCQIEKIFLLFLSKFLWAGFGTGRAQLFHLVRASLWALPSPTVHEFVTHSL